MADEITSRQHEVLELVGRGLASKEIAFLLELSEAGVKKHLSVLMRMYGVSNRTALVRAAIRRGALTP